MGNKASSLDCPVLTNIPLCKLVTCNNMPPSILKSRIRETKHLSTDADSSTDRCHRRVNQGKISKKKKNYFLRCDFRPLPNKNVQMLDHFFSLLFPKDSESLKILDIRLREVGSKRPLKKTENRRRPKKFK